MNGAPGLTAIVAVDANWAIGRDNRLLFPIPADLRRFRALTTGHTILMGRKTLESFPKGPLPNRRNVVLSRSLTAAPTGAELADSLSAALALVDRADTFVIGGESVYRALLPFCDTAYVTRIDAAFPADAWFPDLDADPAWEVAEEEPGQEYEGVSFRYVTYRRIPGAPLPDAP